MSIGRLKRIQYTLNLGVSRVKLEQIDALGKRLILYGFVFIIYTLSILHNL